MPSQSNYNRSEYNDYMRDYMRRYRARKRLAAALARPEVKVPFPLADAYCQAEDKKAFIAKQLALWRNAS